MQFHRKFRLIFSLILSENAPNMDFTEAKFQNFPGSMPPDPLTVLVLLVLDPSLARSTHREFFEIPNWEIHGIFPSCWESNGTINSFSGNLLRKFP